MSKLAVRVAEDPSRPLGHAVIIVEGLPKTLETFEFALRRHGYPDNNLGPEGWQGPDCWLTTEEAWYSGESFKFVVGPQVIYQMESMPYELVLRGQGMPETARVTFVWPLELEVEETGGEREAVGGTRVHPAPRGRGPQAPAEQTVTRLQAPTPGLEAPADHTISGLDVPTLGTVDITIPKLEIPGYEPPLDQARAEPPPLPPEPSLAPPPLPPGPESPGAVEPPPLPPQSGPASAESPPPPPAVLPPAGLEEPPAKRKMGGLIIGAIVLIALIAAGIVGWRVFQKGSVEVPPVVAPPAPVPAPVSKPGAPATRPMPIEPAPAPKPRPSPASASAPAPVTETPSVPRPMPAPAPTSVPVPEANQTPAPVSEPGSPVRLSPAPIAKPAVSAPGSPLAPQPSTVPETIPMPEKVHAPDKPAPVSAPNPSPTPTPAAIPIPKPPRVDERGRGPKRNLESELKSQFDSDLESELESTLKRKPAPQSVPPERKSQ